MITNTIQICTQESFPGSERVQTVLVERKIFLEDKRKEKGGKVLPFSSCRLRLSRGTKVPSALAITSDFVFAYCILCDNHIISINSVYTKRKSSKCNGSSKNIKLEQHMQKHQLNHINIIK